MAARPVPSIRIRKIILRNFRNITYAEIEIPDSKIEDIEKGKPSMLGIYGQNGSGKSSLLIALKALKTALMGERFDFAKYGSCIQAGFKSSRLEFEFSAYSEEFSNYEIYYSFSIGCEEDDQKITVFDELIQFSEESKKGKKINKQVLIDTSEAACKASGKPFGNKTKYFQLIGDDKEKDQALNDAKVESIEQSRSYIFSENVISKLINTESETYGTIMYSLVNYGYSYLNIVLMHETTSDLLTLCYWTDDQEEGGFVDKVVINVNDCCEVADYDYMFVKKSIPNISAVMSAIIPGMSIEIEDLGVTGDGTLYSPHRFKLISVRDDKRIPLMYESEGIRRLISFISLIIAAYNDPSVTVAIDEIDSGLFEYLLGELLEIIKDSAKGQLIFTCHNLRPLEILPRRNLLFTTNDPEKRFQKLEGISGNNNLRDCYYKQILKGKGTSTYYNSSNEIVIKKAMTISR